MTAPIDTNVLIRFFTRDDPALSARAAQTMRSLESGTCIARFTEAVFIESEQVLSSVRLYNVPRAAIRRHLAAFIRLRGVQMENKSRYLRALEIYEEEPQLSLVDALLAAYAEADTRPAVRSFDRGFDRLAWLQRDEP